MLALLSLLDLVYMLRSTLAATLLKIIALPVPLLRQVLFLSLLGVFFLDRFSDGPLGASVRLLERPGVAKGSPLGNLWVKKRSQNVLPQKKSHKNHV